MDTITNNTVVLSDSQVATIGTPVTLTEGIKHDPLFFRGACGVIIEFRDGNVQVRICSRTRSISPLHLKLSALQ